FCPVDACCPTSFAYSGSTTATPPFGSVARCHAPRNAASRSAERIHPLMRSPSAALDALDREALDIGVGLCRIERLLHHRKALGRRRRGRQPGLLHETGCVRGEEDFARDACVV